MSRKSILQKTFDALKLSIDANVNCELTPRQCKELLELEDRLQKYISVADREIVRLQRLLELERSDD